VAKRIDRPRTLSNGATGAASVDAGVAIDAQGAKVSVGRFIKVSVA